MRFGRNVLHKLAVMVKTSGSSVKQRRSVPIDNDFPLIKILLSDVASKSSKTQKFLSSFSASRRRIPLMIAVRTKSTGFTTNYWIPLQEITGYIDGRT